MPCPTSPRATPSCSRATSQPRSLLAKFHPREIAVQADYDFHGTYTKCRDDALWHFNIHPEHMYDLYHNHIMGYNPCQGIVRFCCG